MLNLNELVKHDTHVKTLTITDRLPHYLSSPCEVTVRYQAEKKDDFYVLNLHVSGAINTTCQRCMEEYDLAYDNSTILAICRNDERAEQLLEHYECVVSANGQIQLEELIIDELHLYVPHFHPEISDCSSEVNQILTR